jgi:hypothetical protein
MEVKKKTFNAWITYQAIQAHFTREYDYFKYNGKLNMNEHSMDKHFAKHETGGNFSAQRTIFSNLGKVFDSKEDLIFFYLSQVTNNVPYPSMFDHDLYDEYKERMNNFHFHLKRDIEEIMKYMDEYDKTFDEMFIAKRINHPPIMKLGLSKTISLETFTTLDIMLDFLTAMEKKLIDPASKDFIKLVKNYKPFLSISVDKEKKIIMDVLNKG